MSFVGNCCPECGEPFTLPYPLENAVGTSDLIRNCKDPNCGYWECIPGDAHE